MTSSPHRAPGQPRCWSVQLGTPAGTVPVMVVSLQAVTFVIGTPPMVALGQLPVVGQLEGRVPKP